MTATSEIISQSATVLFADIEKFSTLKEDRQIQACTLLRDHAIQTLGDLTAGTLPRAVVKMTGDGLLVVRFPIERDRPLHDFAVVLQHLMRHEGYRLRQGIHSGRVYLIRGIGDSFDVVGDAVNTCARVMSLGDRDHILLSDNYMTDVMASDPNVFDLGPREVKHGQEVHIHNYHGESTGIAFGNPATPPRLPWTRRANGVGLELGCDDVEIYPDRTHVDFPYSPLSRCFDDGDSSVAVTVVSRTARRWQEAMALMADAVRTNRLTLLAVLTDPTVDPRVLTAAERTEYFTDLADSLRKFSRLEKELTAKHQVSSVSHLLSPTMVLDSLTLVQTTRVAAVERRVFFDIYTGSRHSTNRPCLVITHRRNETKRCLVALLEERIRRVKATAGFDVGSDDVSKVLDDLDSESYEPSRSNPTTRLLPHLPALFEYVERIEPYLIAGSEPLAGHPVRPAPVCVQIEITSRCNVRGCVGCSRAAATPCDMAPATFEEILFDLQHMGTRNLVLSGGEPFCHPEILDILKLCRGRGFHVAVLTDGLQLEGDETLQRDVTRSVESLRISLGAIDPQIYRAVHWLPPSHHAFADPAGAIGSAVRQLSEKRQDSDSVLRHVGICMPLFHRNAEHVAEVGKWAAEQRGIDSLVYKFGHGVPADVGRPDPFVCTFQDVETVQMALRQLSGERTLSLMLNSAYVAEFIDRTGVLSIASGKPTQQLYDGHGLICFTPCLFAVIDPSGGVYPCCHLYFDNSADHRHRLNFLQGRLNPQSGFKDIWTETSFQRLKTANGIRPGVTSADEVLQCCCPMRGECTRHWKHNFELTKIYRNFSRWSLTARRRFVTELERRTRDLDPEKRGAFWL